MKVKTKESVGEIITVDVLVVLLPSSALAAPWGENSFTGWSDLRRISVLMFIELILFAWIKIELRPSWQWRNKMLV